MSHFVQLHFLTSYPPANLNRDDLGRPKTAVMGGAQRLRVSSQCLKRTWRTSEVFKEALGSHVGTRTKRLGPQLVDRLVAGGRTENQALDAAKSIAEKFGKIENDKKKHAHKQLVHYSPAELAAIDALIDTLIEEQRDPEADELKLLREEHASVDIAMFGRMLADTPRYNMEAAVQVAHALSVHEAAVEDDFFTAVDDLNDGRDDSGSAHMGQIEFGAGLFYTYVCIDREELTRNLGGNKKLAATAIRALSEAAATVAPSGKQNSFGSRAYANFVLAERGDQQPRSLSVAFLKPVSDENYLSGAIKALSANRRNMEQCYGPCASAHYEMNVPAGEGTLAGLLDFVASDNSDDA
jgi:CRISPR system Cascade subunit CasC